MWPDNHPRVGLLLNSVTDAPDVLVWSGVLEAAHGHGVDLVCFDCGHGMQVGALCDLAGPEAVDGLVIRLRDDDPRLGFVKQRVGSLPLVNLADAWEGYPGIVGGNYHGMCSLLRHLIEAHGHRRLAFVQDDVGYGAADARYRAYVDVLSEYGLTRAGSLLVAADRGAEARPDAAEKAARALLDQGGQVPDAIVCCTDAVALGLVEALSRRGLHVPSDIAVTGFDDIPDGQAARPPLTSVAQPWRKMGARALELVLAQLQGGPVPAQMVVPCELVVRESCGCWLRPVTEAGVVLPTGLSWPKRRALLLSQIIETLGGEGIGENRDLAQTLVDGLSADIQREAGRATAFLPMLRSVLNQLPPGSELNSVWQTVLSVLRRHMLASPDVAEDSRDRAESLLEQARVLVGDAALRAQAVCAARAVQQARAIERVGTSLSAHFDLGRLSSVAARELPRFGITSLYLCLYEEEATSGQWCRLVAGYDVEGPLELEYGGRRFSSYQVLPADVLTGHQPYALLVEPLLSAGQQLGYVVFDGRAEGEVFDSLRSQLSSTLQGMLLLQQTERDAIQLQTAAEVGRAVSSVLAPDRLMQTVVDLVLERLDLYYVGLFLVDESGAWSGQPGRWAVLRAGTGQSGRQMLADGHKLEVDGASMVGQCIAQGRARIALDVGKEPVRFDNPLLPHTRSELALPLVSRERLIGAMTIQSVQAGAFSAQDIAALQLMADQLANAVETARLYATTREALQRTQILYETSRALSATPGEASTLSAVLAGLSRQAGCVYAVLFAADWQTGVPTMRGAMWRGEQDALPDWLHDHCSLDEGGPLAEAYASGVMQTVHGWDERIDPRHYEKLGVGHLVRVLAPIRRRDETVGVIEVAYDAAVAGTIDEQDTDWLVAFLDQASVAMENARLLAQLQQRLRREQILREVSDRVRGAMDVESVLRTSVEEVSRVLGRPAFIRLNGDATVRITSQAKEGQRGV